MTKFNSLSEQKYQSMFNLVSKDIASLNEAMSTATEKNSELTHLQETQLTEYKSKLAIFSA